MEQPYRANMLIIKSVGMLPGASAEYTSLSMNVQHIKKHMLHHFLTQPGQRAHKKGVPTGTPSESPRDKIYNLILKEIKHTDF